MPWDPAQYRKFADERAAPFEDLFRLIDARAGLHVIDLGCGTGELTALLAERLPESDVLGVDASAEMLGEARRLERLGLRFESRAIEEIDGSWDVVFSNAALQWVDDHRTLIPSLFTRVRPGGQIVVQMPSNQRQLPHRLIAEVAGESPFRESLDGWTRATAVLPIDEYATLLHDAGATGITVFEKVYPHAMSGIDALVEWSAGTAMVPYFERMPPEIRAEFVARYRAQLAKRIPAGPLMYPFRRTLFAARQPG